ncbi:AAA family ATPase [Bradyrhizobium sp. GCM10023182]|uniref:ATP-binding protein n=1 Tax=Bradyrhizobium zhengyangense TaxID=2911009 RepID=A0ABS9LTG0_9BRAD|nr:ATP-binding protein [Bradyrhizobium zhengyangense]
MADEFSAKKIGLPEIHRIKLANFDLYSLQPNADVRVDKNVFCLIGANGLGKSTFLNTLIYGLTGAIPDPSRKFSSAPEYFKEAMRSNRTEDYFSGRISEESYAFL